MNLSTLATLLRQQAKANNTLVLDSTILPSGQLTQINIAFILGSGQNLTVNGVSDTDIPAPINNTLTIEAGTSSLLNQKNIPIKLIFSINGGEAQALIQATMPSSWVFSDSFDGLVQFPFNSFSLTEPNFIYAPEAQQAYMPWTGQQQQTIALQNGLNFASWLSLNGFSTILTLLSQILGTNTSFCFFGPFIPSPPARYPVGTLSALLSNKSFTIGYAPFDLQISTPVFCTEISAPSGLIQDFELSLQATLSLGLNFSLGINSTGDSLTFGATPIHGKPFTANEIIQLPGGANFQSYIPTALTNFFSTVGLNFFTLVMLTKTQKVGYVELAIATVQPWPVITNEVILDNLVLNIKLVDPAGTNSLTFVSLSATAEILPGIFKGKFSFSVNIQKSGSSGWQVTTIAGQFTGTVTLSDIVQSILGSGVSIPKALQDITFSNFGISVDETNNSYTINGNCAFSFPLIGSQLSSNISINIGYSSTGYSVILNGSLLIGTQDFAFELDFSKQKSGQDVKLTASWAAPDSNYVTFEDIASAFGLTIPDIPDTLDLSLKSASLVYDFTNNTLALGASSATYGAAVFVSLPISGTQQYFFLLGVDQSFSLSNLPLIGSDLAQVENIAVGNFLVVVSSVPANTSAIVTAVNSMISDLPAQVGITYPQLPSGGTTGDFVLSAQVIFGNNNATPIMLSLGGSGGSGSGAPPHAVNQSPTKTVVANSPVAVASSTDTTTWFNLQKSFGPVTFQRIGVMYQSSQQSIWFELDASLALGPLTITLTGLGIGSPLSSFAPEFSLQGLGISYLKPPLSIAGSFVNLNPSTGVEFDGSVMVGAESFQIQAFGFYGNQTGATSMFIFGDVAASFGGPPAFFVTGVALGFGYNSALRLPTINEVEQFPFIEVLPNVFPPNQLAPPKTPQDALAELLNATPPWVTEQQGPLWFAAGITFTSFDIVNSQALVIVETGADLTISLIGTSKAQFPQGAGAGVPVYAYIALDLEVTFKPEDGIFSLEAVLSNASFLIDRACTLTGGFAFYVWFGNNPYAGDFVVTLGGYNPGFVAPSYYPTVPKLGFHWSLDSSISISGNAYLAFTPSVLMVGGELSAVYQSGNLKAWFDAHADVIVQWKPFWFNANIGISIGASYKVDLLLTSFTVSVELGCDLQLWGPPTGGSVYVDWYIISFTIPFGSSNNHNAQPLTWTDVQAMLPNTGTASTPNILSLTPTSGLTPATTKPDSSTSGSSAWIVRGSQFGFNTSSSIPATTATVGAAYTFNGSPFNVAPLSLTNVKATHSVTITNSGGDDYSLAFTVVQQQQNLPASLWGTQSSSTPSGSGQLIPDMIVGVSALVNPPQIGSSAGAVNVELYLEGVPLNLPNATLSISTTAGPTGDIPQNPLNTISIIADTTSGGIASTGIINARNTIFTALGAAGYQPITKNDPMTNFANDINGAFSAEPMLVN